MKKYLYWLVLLLLTLGGCVGRGHPTVSFLDLAPPRPMPEAVTLLPILDSRSFPPDFQAPNLNQGAPVLIAAGDVMKLGEQVWRREGLVSDLIDYQGVLPKTGSFTWDDFPLRDLKTDLALGVELKSFELKKIGPNYLLPAHAVLDSALMPAFALGAVATDGHLDLAASMLPSSRVKFTIRADLNFISLKAGGHFFTKTYLVDLTDPLVSDRELYQQAFRTPGDGQEYARTQTPKVIEKIFTWMARDPELQMLPRLARVLWLGQVLVGQLTRPEVSLKLLDETAGGIELPPLTQDQLDTLSQPYLYTEEKLAKVQAQSPLPPEVARHIATLALDPVWLEQAKGTREIFEALYRVLLAELSRLGHQEMLRPLTSHEKALQDRMLTLLVSWSGNPEANRLFRATVTADQEDLEARKAMFLVLGRDLEALGTDDFVKKYITQLAGQLTSPDLAKRQEAAALLVASGGENAAKAHTISRPLLLAVLSGGDAWAAPLVMESLDDGNLSSDPIRLAGALNLRPAVPILIRALNTSRHSLLEKAMAESRDIPLNPTGPGTTGRAGTDPLTLARVLGYFPNNPEAARALGSIVDQWRSTDQPQLAAAALEALARLEPARTSVKALGIWQTEWDSTQGNSYLRRAGLGALAISGESRQWAEVLRKARNTLDHGLSSGLVAPPFTNEQLGAFRETADFFGQVQYKPAVPVLVRLVDIPSGTATLQQAAFNALGLIADQEAESRLRTLAGRARKDQADRAAAALEKLVREKAVRQQLKRSLSHVN